MARLLALLLVLVLSSCAPWFTRVANTATAGGVEMAFDGLDVVLRGNVREVYAQLEGENFVTTDAGDNCRPVEYYIECYRQSVAGEWRIEVGYRDSSLPLRYYADARFLFADGTPGRVQAQ